MASSFTLKKQFLEKGFPQIEVEGQSLNLNYYGIPLKLTTADPLFRNELYNFHPKSWQSNEQSDAIEFKFLDYKQFFHDDFFEEENPDFHVSKLGNARICIQRDFIGWTFDDQTFFFITDLKIDDGYFNCMRWAVPSLLLKNDSLVLHSSCVADNKEAWIFLGQSGAGKTTTVKSLSKNIVLGDDMNVISLRNDGIYAHSGAIGGQVVYPHFDQGFKLQGMFWLNKNQTLGTKRISPEDAQLKLLGSIANVFFGFEDQKFIDEVINKMSKVARTIPMYELSLMKGDDIWPVIRNP